MKKFLMCFLILLMLSCKEDNLEVVIAGKNHKYWMKLSNKTQSQIFYYFDRQGKWLVFIKPYKECTMKKYNGGDVMLIEKWSVVHDSVLNIGGMIYEVVKINNDSIIINNTYFKDTLVYMSSPPPIRKGKSVHPTPPY